ncbi:unnamed protein product [Eruca vesicaria subsp. sativa]|uniref:Uncharacterized protein n=1 Tax=Eruca vesicaria subsp. sativa TaxID=29727 RepID=A0ABC8LH74_ERUVS|nr:unnamed protein product [Eruca vesicaria subsp. sativa]
MRSLCLVICFLAVFTSARVSPRSSLDSLDLRITTILFVIAEDMGLPRKNLRILDVSYNDLHGRVPEFRKGVVYAEGNPHIEKDVISRKTEPIGLQPQPSSAVSEIVVASDDNAIPFHILIEATAGFSDGNVIGRVSWLVTETNKESSVTVLRLCCG